MFFCSVETHKIAKEYTFFYSPKFVNPITVLDKHDSTDYFIRNEYLDVNVQEVIFCDT